MIFIHIKRILAIMKRKQTNKNQTHIKFEEAPPSDEEEGEQTPSSIYQFIQGKEDKIIVFRSSQKSLSSSSSTAKIALLTLIRQ